MVPRAGAVVMLVLSLATAACSEENGTGDQGSLAHFRAWLTEIDGVRWAERVDSFALNGGVLSARLNDDRASAAPPGEATSSVQVRMAYDVCIGISQYVFTSLNETEATAISVRSSSREVLVTRKPSDDFCLVEVCDDADEVAGIHVPPCREGI